MSIEYAHLHSLTAREIISALNRDGFRSRAGRRGTGSHQRFQHPDGRRVTATFHKSSDTFTPKTLRSMFEQARWTEEDLRRLKLIRVIATYCRGENPAWEDKHSSEKIAKSVATNL